MILLGFNALLHETGATDMQGAAQSAAEFLVGSMDEEGCFIRHISHHILHAYNVRSAWALAGYAQLSGADSFRKAALANAAWTIAQQNEAGLYENNSFKPGWPANTHGLAYVMQGLLQIHDLTGSRTCIESVVAAADTVRSLHHRHGWIAAELGPEGEFLSHHVCLTGYAQLAIVLYRLFQSRGTRLTAPRLTSSWPRSHKRNISKTARSLTMARSPGLTRFMVATLPCSIRTGQQSPHRCSSREAPGRPWHKRSGRTSALCWMTRQERDLVMYRRCTLRNGAEIRAGTARQCSHSRQNPCRLLAVGKMVAFGT